MTEVRLHGNRPSQHPELRNTSPSPSLGEQEHTAGPGTVAVLPRRLRHAYLVTSATARFLTLHIPAGFEQFAAEAGQPAPALTVPPEPAAPPDPAALARIAARHGITILAPPPQP